MVDFSIAYDLYKLLIASVACVVVFALKNSKVSKSTLIISVVILVNWLVSQFTKEKVVFDTQYTAFAMEALFTIVLSAFVHVSMRIFHDSYVYIIYMVFGVKFMSLMIVHIVRLKVFTSDEPIIWLLNLHSFVVIFSDVFIVLCLFFGGCLKWKLSSYSRYSS